MSGDDDNNAPGTAAPARLRKAGCGFRFDEEELKEGIDFSSAEQLKAVDDDASTSTSTGEDGES